MFSFYVTNTDMNFEMSGVILKLSLLSVHVCVEVNLLKR